MIELKERLAAIAKHVPEGSVPADVGTDHAYLPVFLVQSGVCRQAFGTDIHQGPFDSAVEQVRSQGLSDAIKIYLGNGLLPLEPGQVDAVVIAGMGGTTIRGILTASPDVLGNVRRLILQPMVAGGMLRRWLSENGWQIIDEQLVEEDSRIYEIIVAEPGEGRVYSEVIMELGPKIVSKRDQLLSRVVENKVNAMEEIIEQLGHSERPELLAKKEELLQRIRELRGVLL